MLLHINDMHRMIKMGCRTTIMPVSVHARCDECGWIFRVAELLPAFDGTLVSRTCMKDSTEVEPLPIIGYRRTRYDCDCDPAAA